MIRRAMIGALALASLQLTACSGEDHSDLRAWIKEQDKLPPRRIPPLPEVKPYEPFAHNAYDLTDPFKPRKIEPPKSNKGGIQPDLNRPREALEAFPLEGLAMVGTLEQKGATYALVRAPDKGLYRVAPGSYLGQNFGRITAISDSEIKLKEIVQDSGGTWEEKDQALLLQGQETAK